MAAEDVRAAFCEQPQAGSVVLIDAERHPTAFVDRNRFLLAVSGPYGHALYAKRPATALADPPRTVSTSTDVAAALEYGVADRFRSWDDLVVLDAGLSCAGIVRMVDLLRAATGVRASSVA